MKVKMYIWPTTINNVGHISLEMTTADENLIYRKYISLWPNSAVKPFYTIHGISNTLATDIYNESRKVKLPELEKIALDEQIRVIKEFEKLYHNNVIELDVYQQMNVFIDTVLQIQKAEQIVLYDENSKIKLDEEAMINYWREYLKTGAEYNLCGKNCCTIIANILRVGGAEDFVRMPNKHTHVWTSAKMKNYAKKLQDKISEFQQKDFIPSPRKGLSS